MTATASSAESEASHTAGLAPLMYLYRGFRIGDTSTNPWGGTHKLSMLHPAGHSYQGGCTLVQKELGRCFTYTRGVYQGLQSEGDFPQYRLRKDATHNAHREKIGKVPWDYYDFRRLGFHLIPLLLFDWVSLGLVLSSTYLALEHGQRTFSGFIESFGSYGRHTRNGSGRFD